MKAKEYAERFKKDGSTVQSLVRVITDMVLEIKVVAKQRHATSDESILTILDEMNAKYGSFCRQVGTLDTGEPLQSEGFVRVIKEEMTSIFTVWNNRRGGRLLRD